MATSSSGTTTSANIMSHERHAYARAILGAELFERLATSRVLVVGAGGIGCELLKNLVLVGFGHVEIIDLDTIDLSNLNRQFLFQKVHIGKPKSIVATATALQFNPLIDIQAHHANVKDTQRFGWEFFETFDVVCNALDNLDARRWVNKMCVMTGVALVESGTTGFLGQVQPIAPGQSDCYDCTDKPTPRTYPVCTIRSTPSTPIHCIVWAKTYLFPQLFGAKADTEDAELDKALKDGENASEIENLRKEGREMGAMRDAVFAASLSDGDRLDLCQRIFLKIFKTDVERLLSMEDMWRTRTKPVPLEFDQQQEENVDGNRVNGGAADTVSTLRDQRVLSLRETIEQFSDSLMRLSRRASALGQGDENSLSFDKDDIDAMDFVTATANLRMRVYHIAPQSRFQVKEMAGNIIPAIASTNAIIAGAQVLQTLHALRRRWRKARFVSLNPNAARMVTSLTLGKPSPACGVCQDDYVRARVDVERATLADVKAAVMRARAEQGLGFDVQGMELYEGERLLADEDFDDNLERTLSSLGIKTGMLLTCIDEDGVQATLNVYISAPVEQNGEEACRTIEFGKTANLPILRKKPAVAKSQPEVDDDDVVEEVQPSEIAATTASKRKRSNEDEEDSSTAAAATEAGQKKLRANDSGAIVSKTNKQARTGAREDDAIELD